MFRSLVTALVLASGLALSGAPASAQDWGQHDGWGGDRGAFDERGGWDQNPRRWDGDGYVHPHWSHFRDEDERWGDDRVPQVWRDDHDERDGHDWRPQQQWGHPLGRYDND